MTEVFDDGVDHDLRKAWDAAMLAAVEQGEPTLTERAEALDAMLTQHESSLRAGYVVGGRLGFDKAAMRRCFATRRTLDLLHFFVRNGRDEVLSTRIKELKAKEDRA
jgi:hypothetical protein